MSTFGIDLGTTYSCISKLDDHGNPVIVQNLADSSDTLASAVYFESAENVIVGNAAKDMVETDGARVVEFVKREIGKKDGRTFEFDGKTYTPVEISSLILKRIREMAEEQGDTVTDVVITCPAYFGYEERNATKEAGTLIGLNVLDIINEPTAAALSYCARQFQEERTILVYDLGGGTFDVTIIKMGLTLNDAGEEVQQIRVLASGGNDRLGGKDWDDILFSYIENACCEENGLTPEDLDPETRQQIRSKVETTKKRLSTADKAKVKITVNGAITNLTVTREEFENLTAGKVSQTMGYIDDVLTRAGNPPIDVVLLVGGSTFMPMIRSAVEKRFEGVQVQLHEPNLAVAKGAAIYANMLVEETNETGNGGNGGDGGSGGEGGDDGKGGEGGGGEGPDGPGKDTGGGDGGDDGRDDGPIVPKKEKPGGGLIVDQLPRSFGPGVLNENDEYIIDNLVKQGDVSPGHAQREYYTPRADMKLIRLKVFESLSLEDTVIPSEDGAGNPMASEPRYAVKYLGELNMELPPGTPAGSPIAVDFYADMTGIHVHTTDVNSGTEAEVQISFASNIDKENSAVHGMKVYGE